MAIHLLIRLDINGYAIVYTVRETFKTFVRPLFGKLPKGTDRNLVPTTLGVSDSESTSLRGSTDLKFLT